MIQKLSPACIIIVIITTTAHTLTFTRGMNNRQVMEAVLRGQSHPTQSVNQPINSSINIENL
jgi:hypothetical protein